MLRRTVLGILVILTAILAIFLYSNSWIIDKIIGRIKGILTPAKSVSPESERAYAQPPSEGRNISVEMALNSRCCSDSDDNQRYGHWGMFDNTSKITHAQVKEIINLVKIPRFTNRRIEIESAQNLLTFSVKSLDESLEKDWVMIESGMQQQAVCLVCAALGVGMVFRNLGPSGSQITPDRYGNVRMWLDAMKPSYDGYYWSKSAPQDRKPWQKGNLPEPVRDGNIPLLSVLPNLQKENIGSKDLTMEATSQLLWAARGRTPHLYKSKPWGMTIPIWTDEFEITAVYVVSDGVLRKYINWENGRPTHSLKFVNKVSDSLLTTVSTLFDDCRTHIILGINDTHARALWEVGYQLFNMLAQSYALNITYKAFLFNDKEKNVFKSIGIDNPVAMLAIY